MINLTDTIQFDPITTPRWKSKRTRPPKGSEEARCSEQTQRERHKSDKEERSVSLLASQVVEILVTDMTSYRDAEALRAKQKKKEEERAAAAAGAAGGGGGGSSGK
ncbi:hypothetical protein FRB93_012442 [Tulasnella sp. JGI-2019a]|nr:hypothetical protein FRB93_012442 [Tulasnella sp. JGI-2019a]